MRSIAGLREQTEPGQQFSHRGPMLSTLAFVLLALLVFQILLVMLVQRLIA